MAVSRNIVPFTVDIAEMRNIACDVEITAMSLSVFHDEHNVALVGRNLFLSRIPFDCRRSHVNPRFVIHYAYNIAKLRRSVNKKRPGYFAQASLSSSGGYVKFFTCRRVFSQSESR